MNYEQLTAQSMTPLTAQSMTPLTAQSMTPLTDWANREQDKWIYSFGEDN